MRLPKAFSKYGASTGRTSQHLETHEERETAPIKLHLQRVRLDSGGYDNGGAYWGTGDPLYYVWSDDGQVDYFTRGRDREDVKNGIRTLYKKARFFR